MPLSVRLIYFFADEKVAESSTPSLALVYRFVGHRGSARRASMKARHRSISNSTQRRRLALENNHERDDAVLRVARIAVIIGPQRAREATAHVSPVGAHRPPAKFRMLLAPIIASLAGDAHRKRSRLEDFLSVNFCTRAKARLHEASRYRRSSIWHCEILSAFNRRHDIGSSLAAVKLSSSLRFCDAAQCLAATAKSETHEQSLPSLRHRIVAQPLIMRQSINGSPTFSHQQTESANVLPSIVFAIAVQI